MEYREVRSKKLLFKGDPATGAKRKADSRISATKRKSKQNHYEPGASKSASSADAANPATGWVFATSLEDLEGPIALYHRDEQLHVLALPSKEEALTLADLGDQPPALYALGGRALSLVESEPSNVGQVFAVRKSVPTARPSDPEGAMVSLKSFAGMYLSADKCGRVACSSAAIGALEMWTPILLPDRGDGAVAFMIRPPGTAEDRFLSAGTRDATSTMAATGTEAAAETHSTLPSLTIPAAGVHANGKAIGYSQVFFAKCQAAIKQKRQTAAGVEGDTTTSAGVSLTGDVGADEAAQIKRFQGLPGKRPRPANERGTLDLDQAKLAGKYSEGLLDRREKTKSDRYCK
ncbi:hypothetical protein GGI04_002027 [Coemansia thaxteri]|uniref:Protein FRG1 n=1 Tax=Coemansia thaxteri TaxID=2663907 RepID=A0A9W8BL33_9FUNG|nr:hypothetical protein H4R26_002377 [Coemansia thaxteri]KAJ2006019.1 hypothetical protein GGI04_002027 [Coemansia thaxteri]KAJ2471634.1 hypothetical protein GGI02_002139 [Coemansia sp. RSA 2322]KAJ2481401.1 hypothetical protein EV174_003482 [Coemansia sp. RSA 2320]